MIARRFWRMMSVLLLCGMAAGAEVINRGYPGANTAELDARFDTVLALHPKVVVLFAGANDALNPAKFLSPEASAEHLQAMVARAKAAGVQVVLVTVHDPDVARLMTRHKPTDYGTLPALRRVAEVDRVIRKIAAKSGARLVDFHAVLQAHGGANAELSTDGLHLTRGGYGLLAQAVKEKLPPLAREDVVVCFGDSLTYGIGVREPGDAKESAYTYPAQLRDLLEQ